MRIVSFTIAAGLVAIAAACSSNPTAEGTGTTTAALDDTCDFKCECTKKGGTVDGDNWCCKHDSDGSKTCTNHPEMIISWRGTDPLPPVKDPKAVELLWVSAEVK